MEGEEKWRADKKRQKKVLWIPDNARWDGWEIFVLLGVPFYDGDTYGFEFFE